jgi:hypothetical protein
MFERVHAVNDPDDGEDRHEVVYEERDPESVAISQLEYVCRI